MFSHFRESDLKKPTATSMRLCRFVWKPVHRRANNWGDKSQTFPVTSHRSNPLKHSILKYKFHGFATIVHIVAGSNALSCLQMPSHVFSCFSCHPIFIASSWKFFTIIDIKKIVKFGSASQTFFLPILYFKASITLERILIALHNAKSAGKEYDIHNSSFR